ncbi:hypothetical protein F2Q69_00052312 [Brassica cretica]|uniref:Uncharacterized protein n=1 Tax=Brassica cretica TaxID=69181 RepID=A0A8S9MWV6_BRACR|nr:hypothetical protein F2Q69_00052312 [Brassica cretica]
MKWVLALIVELESGNKQTRGVGSKLLQHQLAPHQILKELSQNPTVLTEVRTRGEDMTTTKDKIKDWSGNRFEPQRDGTKVRDVPTLNEKQGMKQRKKGGAESKER